MKVRECIPCLGSDVKEAIRELRNNELDIYLEKIPDCTDPLGIKVCNIKLPRKKSAYQLFVSDCMKSKPIKGKPFGEAAKYMKDCTAEWGKSKNEAQSR